jgi:hypothetical protein
MKKFYCEWCGIQIYQPGKGRNKKYCPACAKMIEHFNRYLRNAFRFVFGDNAHITVQTNKKQTIRVEGIIDDSGSKGRQTNCEVIPACKSVGFDGKH